MIQHLESMAKVFRDGQFVKEHILPPDQVYRLDNKRKKKASEGEVPTPTVEPNKTIVRDMVFCFNILDLEPVSWVEREGAKTFLRKYLPQTEVSRKVVQRTVNEISEAIQQEVMEAIRIAKEKGAKFTIQADAWKPKFRRGRRK